MTTQRNKAVKKSKVIVDTKSVDVIEEVVIEEAVIEEAVIEEVVSPLPQLYQSTVSIKKGAVVEIIGHIQFSDTTGELTAIPSNNTKYGVDLGVVVSSGIISKTDSSVVFSPHTKTWLRNVHNGILPRGWEATEAWNRDEV
jgi:hypothetical protein